MILFCTGLHCGLNLKPHHLITTTFSTSWKPATYAIKNIPFASHHSPMCYLKWYCGRGEYTWKIMIGELKNIHIRKAYLRVYEHAHRSQKHRNYRSRSYADNYRNFLPLVFFQVSTDVKFFSYVTVFEMGVLWLCRRLLLTNRKSAWRWHSRLIEFRSS